MGIRGTRRGGDAHGLYKLVTGDQAKTSVSSPVVITIQTPVRYCAVEDVLFPGTWRAEPESYRGRGVVYLFRGEMAKYEALAWAKKKNRQWGFV